MNLVEAVLDSLSHARLKRLSDSFNAKPEDLRRSVSIREAISATPKLSERDLLGCLNVEELKELCKLYKLPSRGRRPELVRALLDEQERKSKGTAPDPEDGRRGIKADHFVAIDFETANQSRDSACAVALVTVRSGKILARSQFLIKPPGSAFTNTRINGISLEDVKNAPTFEEIWPEILPKIERAEFLAAHNASFDRSVLDVCCRKYGLAPPAKPFECTVKWARKVWNLMPTKLPDVCRFFDIPLIHHDALSDAEACAKIMIKIKEETLKH